MSRALTAWTPRVYSPERQEQIERLMEDRGVSEPVARNLLKFAALGIGPLVDEGVAERYGVGRGGRHNKSSASSDSRREQSRRPLPVQNDVTATDLQAAKKAKLLQQETLLRAQEAAREQELAEEEQARQERMQKARRGVSGIARLGPVLAREEQVDPLPTKLAAAAVPPQDPEPNPLLAEEDKSNAGWMATASNAKPKQGTGRPDEAKRKTKKKRKKRRGNEDSDDSESDRSRSRSRRGKGRSRSRSGNEDGGVRNGLMSEAEVLRRMNLEEKSTRGSLRAKSRIQKEIEVWEAAKRSNKEYWRPPRHCLCFASETAKRREEPRR